MLLLLFVAVVVVTVADEVVDPFVVGVAPTEFLVEGEFEFELLFAAVTLAGTGGRSAALLKLSCWTTLLFEECAGGGGGGGGGVAETVKPPSAVVVVVVAPEFPKGWDGCGDSLLECCC